MLIIGSSLLETLFAPAVRAADVVLGAARVAEVDVVVVLSLDEVAGTVVARRRLAEPAEQGQKRRLPRPRSPEDRDALPRRDRQTYGIDGRETLAEMPLTGLDLRPADKSEPAVAGASQGSRHTDTAIEPMLLSRTGLTVAPLACCCTSNQGVSSCYSQRITSCSFTSPRPAEIPFKGRCCPSATTTFSLWHGITTESTGSRFVLRFERLGTDFASLCDRTGIRPALLPHVDASRREQYRTYFPHQGLIDLVTAKFAAEISRFDYSS